jgi:hypothetical protein
MKFHRTQHVSRCALCDIEPGAAALNYEAGNCPSPTLTGMKNMQDIDYTTFEDQQENSDSFTDENSTWSKVAADLLPKDKPIGTPSLADILINRAEQEKKIEPPAALTEAEIKECSQKITAIIAKMGDFSYGGKNKIIQEMFGKAAAAGQASFDKLVDSVNKQLAAKGIDLKLDAKYQVQAQEELVDLGDIMLTSYPPQYPNARFRQTSYAVAQITLKTKAGEVEDSMDIKRMTSQKTVRRHHVPAVEGDPIIHRILEKQK